VNTVVEGSVQVNLNEQKEQLSYAYIHLVASAAGCTFAFREDGDALGIDITIMGFKELEQGIIIPIPIDAQVKSTSRSTIAERYIHYDLRVKNYNELRVEQYGSPRILIVAVLPDDPKRWLDQSEERLVLRNCAAYWMSLWGAPETTNTSSIRVDVPRANLLTTESLTRLLQVISEGERL